MSRKPIHKLPRLPIKVGDKISFMLEAGKELTGVCKKALILSCEVETDAEEILIKGTTKSITPHILWRVYGAFITKINGKPYIHKYND